MSPASGVPLVVLAAGLGSRYGGIKPLAPVGCHGEPLLYLALQQAARAGFGHAVVVVGKATAGAVREGLGARPLDIAVTFAAQETVGPPRIRPWGTAAALLAASVDGDVVVANGDDLYGEVGLRDALGWMASPGGAAAGIFYPVGGTVTGPGVSRGLPTVVAGRMLGITEQREVRRVNGVVRLSDGTALAEEQPVSMNLWCIRRPVLSMLADAFSCFVQSAGGDPTAEFGLSRALDALATQVRVDALVTTSRWLGVTYAADVAVVRDALCQSAG